MKAALISITEQGADLTARIADLKLCSCIRYAHSAHADALAVPFDAVYALTKELFGTYDALVFECAAGIAVRAIAPCVHSKATDPAVLVLDENARFVIPLLSGHIGGANALALSLAEGLGAVPVITTATDSGGRFSPDSFAVANDLAITDLAAAKAVAAAVLQGEPIGLVSDVPYVNLPPELTQEDGTRIGIYIGTEKNRKPFPVTLHLIPRDLILGIGCRKGASAEQIESQLQAAGIPTERLKAAATIDRKAHEPGLLTFCKAHRLPLYTYTAQELQSVKGNFGASDFVRQTVGVDNVCERSAVLCAGGTLVYPKCAGNGVTCAAAQCAVHIDFLKRRQLS